MHVNLADTGMQGCCLDLPQQEVCVQTKTHEIFKEVPNYLVLLMIPVSVEYDDDGGGTDQNRKLCKVLLIY